ncbi:hypothetical protein LCGC14_0577630 [marine sediment metagenome]|uniref:Phage tail tape measure protein domain-containing protein n=1 Tax=marine sediment metagenome TaxID=412755 RepID=A0A0F9RHG1_9ZZZZ
MAGFGGFGTEIGPATLTVTGSSAGAEAALDRTEKRVFGFATTVRGAGIQMQLFGRGILNMVANVVGTFMTFEDAFIGVQRTVDATEEEFALLEAGIRDMALVIPVAAADLANIMKIAGQMGVRGVENLLVFTETVARMAQVTDLTEESTSFAFARIAAVMQLPIDQVANLGASIVDLGNKFATTEPLIVDASVRAAGAANTLGISAQDLVGIVAALTTVMPRAQSAGSVLARTFTEMAEAGFQGGESLGTFASTVGISTEAMRDLIKTDPTEALVRFLEGLGRLIRSGGNWVEVLDAVGLNQIRTREGALNLAAAGNLLRNTVDTSNTAWDENIALIVESDRRFASLSSQLGLFRNLLTEINIIMGKALAPVIKDVVDRLKPFFQGIREFTEAHPQLIQILGALVAAFGAIAFAAGTALIIAAVVGIFGLVSLSLFLIVVAIIAVAAALGALIIFWPEVKAAMMPFIEAVDEFFSKEGFAKRIGQARDFFRDFGIRLRGWLKDFGVDIRNFLKDLGVNIRNGLKSVGVLIRNELKEFGVGIRNRLKEFGEGIKNTLRDKFDQLITPVEEAFQEILETFQHWWGIISDVVSDNWDTIVMVVQTAVTLVKDHIIMPWFKLLKAMFISGWNDISVAVKAAWDFIKILVVVTIGFIANSFIFWFNTLRNMFQLGWTVISNTVNVIWTTMKNLVLIGIQFISGTIRFWMAILRGDWEAAWDAIRDTVTRIWGLIKDTVTTQARGVKNIVLGIWDAIKDQTSTTWNLIKEIVLGALRGMRGVSKIILNGFIGIFERALNFIITGINTFAGRINNITGGLSFLAGLLGVPSIPEIGTIGAVHIDRLAEGGLALRPTLAVVGDVPELITPLSKIGNMGLGTQNFFIDQVILQGDPQEGLEALGLSVSSI